MRVHALALISLLMLLIAIPATAQADGPAVDRAWSAPTALDQGWPVWDASVAGIAPGRTVVVRAVRDEPDNLIVASVLDETTGFEDPELLDAGGALMPSLDATFAGGAVAAWLNDGDAAVWVAERRAGASGFSYAFGAATCCGDYSGNRPQVAVGERGDAAVAWLARDGDDAQQHVRVSYRPVGGDFGAVEDAGATTAALLRDIALGADGTVAVGWDEGGRATVAVRDPAGDWAVPEVLGSADGERGWISPALGVDGAGRVAAAWREVAPGTEVGAVKLSYRPPGGPFGPPHATGLTTTGVGSSLQLGVSDAGEVVLAAQMEHALGGGGAGVDGIWALYGTTVRGDVGPPARLTDMWGQDPSLAMSPRGDAVVMWDACCPMALGVRRRLPGGSFGAPRDVATPIEVTGARGGRIMRQASIDDAGNAATTWVDFDPDPDDVFVDTDGPVIATVPAAVTSVPATLPAVTVAPGPGPGAEPVVPHEGSPPAPVLPAPVPAPAGRAKPVPGVLTVRVRVRVLKREGRRRAEVRVQCSSACNARVAITLGKSVRLRSVGIRLRRRGEARVRVALPPQRRGAHRRRAWLAVAVTATGADGSHARATSRVRVRV